MSDPPFDVDHVSAAQSAQLAVVDQPNVSAVAVVWIGVLRVHDVPGLVPRVEIDDAAEPLVSNAVIVAGIAPLDDTTVHTSLGHDGNEPVAIVAFVLNRTLEGLRVDGPYGLDGNLGPLRNRNLAPFSNVPSLPSEPNGLFDELGRGSGRRAQGRAGIAIERVRNGNVAGLASARVERRQDRH